MVEFTCDVKLAAAMQKRKQFSSQISIANQLCFTALLDCFTICAPIHLQQQLVAKATEKHKQDLF